jgi:hypothetical protein
MVEVKVNHLAALLAAPTTLQHLQPVTYLKKPLAICPTLSFHLLLRWRVVSHQIRI